jgi:hypothetical protein
VENAQHGGTLPTWQEFTAISLAGPPGWGTFYD